MGNVEGVYVGPQRRPMSFVISAVTSASAWSGDLRNVTTSPMALVKASFAFTPFSPGNKYQPVSSLICVRATA